MDNCHPYGCVTVPSTPGVPTTVVVASDREVRPAFSPDLASTGFSWISLLLAMAAVAIFVGTLTLAARRLVVRTTT
jgi:uncharacterized membrane protein YhaH (DUF805 family)